MATPRLTAPQQGRASGDGVYSYFQNTLPRFASSATTLLTGSVRYMMPSTTSGVAWNGSSELAWKIHASSSWSTFSGVIWSSVVYRLLE